MVENIMQMKSGIAISSINKWLFPLAISGSPLFLSFSIGLVKTESDLIVRSVQIDLRR